MGEAAHRSTCAHTCPNPAAVSDRLKGDAHAHALVHFSRPRWLDPQCATGARRLGHHLDALGRRGSVRDCPPGHRIGPGVPGLGRARHSPGDTGRRAAAHAPPRPGPLRRGAHMGGQRGAHGRELNARGPLGTRGRCARCVPSVASRVPARHSRRRRDTAERRVEEAGASRSLAPLPCAARRPGIRVPGATPFLLRSTRTATSMTSPYGSERVVTTWTSDPCVTCIRQSSAG